MLNKAQKGIVSVAIKDFLQNNPLMNLFDWTLCNDVLEEVKEV